MPSEQRLGSALFIPVALCPHRPEECLTEWALDECLLNEQVKFPKHPESRREPAMSQLDGGDSLSSLSALPTGWLRMLTPGVASAISGVRGQGCDSTFWGVV